MNCSRMNQKSNIRLINTNWAHRAGYKWTYSYVIRRSIYTRNILFISLFIYLFLIKIQFVQKYIWIPLEPLSLFKLAFKNSLMSTLIARLYEASKITWFFFGTDDL